MRSLSLLPRRAATALVAGALACLARLARAPLGGLLIALVLGAWLPAVARAQMSVTPSNDALSAPVGSTQSTTFTLRTDDPNAAQDQIQITCDGAVVSCSTDPWVMISSSSPKTITVNYTVGNTTGATGTITVSFSDEFTLESADGTAGVTVQSAVPRVTADSATQYTGEGVNTSYPWFHVQNFGDTPATYTMTCSGIGTCSVRTQPPTLAPGASANITVDYTSAYAAGGSETLTLTATSQFKETSSHSVAIVPLSEAVRVLPDGASDTVASNATVQVPFTVHEDGNASSGFRYKLTVTCSGSVVSCTWVSTGTDTTSLPPGPNVDQSVSLWLRATSSLAGGPGTVTVTASYTDGWGKVYQDQGSYAITVPDTRSYTPSVTPKGDSTTYNEANVATNAVFTVKNVGNTQATYTITQPTACTGQASGTSCVIRSGYTSLTLASGASSTVPVDYTTGPLNQRVHITLEAQATAGKQPTDTGSIGIVPLSDTVTVVAASGTPTVLTNGTGTYNFTVTNVGNNDNVTYTLQVTGCSAPVVSCSVATSVKLNHGQSATVPVTYHSQSTTGTGQITLQVFIQQVHLYQASATGSITVSSRLAVSTAYMNNDDQDPSRCASACFAVTASRSTVPYYSLDAARSVTLAYNSDRAFPRPFVYADVRMLAAPPTGTTTYRLEVKRKGTDLKFANQDTVLIFQNSGSGGRLAGQLDFTSDTTGLYPVSVVVTAIYSDGTSDVTTVPTNILVVNTTRSASVAKGWTIAGVPRLHLQTGSGVDSTAVITDGTGAALVFSYVNHAYVGPTSDFTTLATRPGGGWVRMSPDSTKVWFRSDGRADSVSDRLGFATVFEYDASGRLWKIHDPMLRKTVPGHDATVLTYDSYGLSSIQEPSPVASGRITSVKVSTDSLLLSVTDPDRKGTSYGYDTYKRLNAITGRNGGTVTYVYGSTDWKLSQMISPPVAIDAGRDTTTLQQPTITFHPWQSVGVPTTSTASTPATPISAGSPSASVVDPVGNVTQMIVDAKGQPTRVTDAVGNVTDYTYSGNLLSSATIPDSVWSRGVSSYNYSGPYLVSAVPAASDTVYYHYGVAAQVDSTWGRATPRQVSYLRSDGRPDSVQTGSARAPRTTKYTYDSLTKRVASVIDPGGHLTSYQYDPVFGNLERTIAPGNRTDSLFFDAYGRDTLVATPAGTRVTQYDVMNRDTLDAVVAAKSSTRYSYTDTSTTVTDAVGNVYRTTFNVLGWKTADYSPDSTLRPITYRYDARGLNTSTTNRRGQMLASTYDPIGRLRTRYDPIAGTTTFSYSSGGFRTVATNGTFTDSTVKQLYCKWTDSTSSQACQSDTTFVTYNGATYTIGHADPSSFADTVTSSTDPAMKFENIMTRTLDLGDPNAVTLGSLTMHYAYDAKDGLRTQTTLPALGTMTDSFTTNHEMYWRQYSDTTVNKTYQRAYHYDLAGRIDYYTQSHNGLSTAAEIRHFGYDAAGRLASNNAGTVQCNGFPGSGTTASDPNQGSQPVCGTPAGTTSYVYDAVGNRQHAWTNTGSDLAPATYATGDRLQSMGSRTYSYDEDGNTTHMSDASTGESRDYYYDASGLLDSVAVSGGSNPGILRLAYDPYNRLSRRWWYSSFTGTGKVRLYLYDRGNVGKEIDVNNQGATTEYAYDGLDHPIMRVVHNPDGTVASTTTYLYDAIGRVEGAITNGVTTSMENYDDWGQLNSGPALSTLRFGFKGMLYDEDVNLYYARNRWYDPKAGRFTQEDPIGLAGGINPYVFAGDDPVNGADPTGTLTYDSDGSVCSINAESCGDPLQFPGSGSGEAFLAWGTSNSGVSYAGGYHGLAIVDQNLRDALTAFESKNPGVVAYVHQLEASDQLYVVVDQHLHPDMPWGAIGPGHSYGGSTEGDPGIETMKLITNFLNLPPAAGLAVINSETVNQLHYDLGKVVAHELAHLVGIQDIGRLYTHGPDLPNEGPFKTFGCTLVNCQP